MEFISWKNAKQYKQSNSRQVALPTGNFETVFMSGSLWLQYEALLELENLSEADFVVFAIEEKSAQLASGVNASFGECFRAVVTDRVLDWFRAAEEAGVSSETL
jgi:hypothetical protein